MKDVGQEVCTYDQKPIALDGCIDMKITFGEENIVTTVYVKLVAPDQLLLSESACHRLGIVSYHPEVQLLRRHQLLEQAVASGKVITTKATTEATTADATTDDKVTTAKATTADATTDDKVITTKATTAD